MKPTMGHEERLARFLAELAQEARGDLLHLLSCPVCRGSAREVLEDEADETPRPPEAAYDRLFEELNARTPGLVQQMAEQSAEVRALFDKLLASPAAQQMALAGSREFGDLRLADLLLSESWSAQPEDPQRSEGLARLALRVADQPYGRPQASRVDDVKARALVLLANARRLQGDLLEADERFRQAVFHLTCPPDADERALYCHMLALLRRDQRREDEVAGLLWRAASVYREIGDLLEEGACLAELGFLFLDGAQVHEAIPPLARACPMLDLHRDVLLGLRARLALAVCYGQAGHTEKARSLLAAARPLYSRVTDSARMAEVTWMEGKVALLAGNREDAPALLDTARKSFLTAGKLYETAFASLDLILALPASRRRESIHPLIHDVVERFPSDMRQAGAVKALGAVAAALAGGLDKDLEEVVSLAAEALRRFRRQPLLAFEGRQPGRPPHASLRLDASGPITDLDLIL